MERSEMQSQKPPRASFDSTLFRSGRSLPPPTLQRETTANHSSRLTFCAPRLALLAILLLAASLRFYRIDAQSFWNDEGNSARLSERSLDLIIAGTASDIHPPGYYLLLHAWRALFGHSEFALRALSAVAGLALVLCTHLLGRRLFGAATGLMAAFLGAISPFAIYYSQEARMYALLAALSAASTYLLLRILNLQSPISNQRVSESANRRTLSFIAYVLAAAAGLYTQYAFAFVLLVHNAVFAVWWLAHSRRCAVARWRWLAVWLGAQAGVVALYLPWLPIAIRSVSGWPSAGQSYELMPALLNVLRWLAVGHTLPLQEAWVTLAGAGALLVVGLWPAPRVGEPSAVARVREGSRWFGSVTLALYLLLPIALIFAFDLYKEAWLKFLIVVLPPFHVLVARGVVNLARLRIGDWRSEIGRFRIPNLRSLIPLVFLILAAIATRPSLQNLYFDPAYFRDDYRQIASDIGAAAPPAGGVVLDAPNQWEVFTYYYPDRDVYPTPYRPDPAEVDAFLAPLVARYRRLYVLYWGDAESDPQRRVESWLAAHAYKADDRWYGRVRLATYGAAPLPEEPAVPLDASFGDAAGAAIHLHGYALAGDPFAPGDVLAVTLFWEAQSPVAEAYKVTVQVLDPAGVLVAQHDGEPVGGLAPTTAWQPDQTVTDRHGVLLPTGLAPGRYTLAVALYHAASGERLDAAVGSESAGDHLVLTDVEIAPAQ
jgi:mannosyltransferase